MDLFSKCHRYLQRHQERDPGFNPYFVPIEESCGSEVVIEGHRVIMLGSNGYLGLAADTRVAEAAAAAVRRWGTSCCGSRLLNGTFSLHLELEEELVDFLGKEAATLFPSGFQTNQGAIAPLLGREDLVFSDRQDHASIVEGIRLGLAEHRKFRHGDLDQLERLLQKAPPEAGKLVVVDGVYSMEGDIADLPRLAELRRRFGFRLLVDDAHGIGVLGPNGAGTAEHLGVMDQVDLITGTFSKSLGSLGGFAAGDRAVIEYLKYNSRALIFSASMPPAATAAALKSLQLLRAEPERRVQLYRNAARLRAGVKAMGLQSIESETPIVPVVVGDDNLTFRFWRRLLDEGVFTNPVISPAVPEGKQLLRCCAMAIHTDEQIDRVLAAFRQVGCELGLTGAHVA